MSRRLRPTGFAMMTAHAGARDKLLRVRSASLSPSLAQGIPRAPMSPAASGGRTVEPVTEEDF